MLVFFLRLFYISSMENFPHCLTKSFVCSMLLWMFQKPHSSYKCVQRYFHNFPRSLPPFWIVFFTPMLRTLPCWTPFSFSHNFWLKLVLHGLKVVGSATLNFPNFEILMKIVCF